MLAIWIFLGLPCEAPWDLTHSHPWIHEAVRNLFNTMHVMLWWFMIWNFYDSSGFSQQEQAQLRHFFVEKLSPRNFHRALGGKSSSTAHHLLATRSSCLPRLWQVRCGDLACEVIRYWPLVLPLLSALAPCPGNILALVCMLIQPQCPSSVHPNHFGILVLL